VDSESEQAFAERDRENGGPTVLRDDREPSCLGVAKEVSRAKPEVADGENVKGVFHGFLPFVPAKRSTTLFAGCLPEALDSHLAATASVRGLALVTRKHLRMWSAQESPGLNPFSA
jgi:hypothetical protein